MLDYMVEWSGRCVSCEATTERRQLGQCIGRCAWNWSEVPAPTVLPKPVGEPVRRTSEPPRPMHAQVFGLRSDEQDADHLPFVG